MMKVNWMVTEQKVTAAAKETSYDGTLHCQTTTSCRHRARPVVENALSFVGRSRSAVEGVEDAGADAADTGEKHMPDAPGVGEILGCDHALIIDETLRRLKARLALSIYTFRI